VFARGDRTLRIHGVTYGPFPPDERGDPFPTPRRVRQDFALMRAAGVNALRTYHAPPAWLLEQATASGLAVFLDVPWPKHLCFLDSLQARRQARAHVARAARSGTRSFP
jgi:beta-galactosidase/beta-glucuronidase